MACRSQPAPEQRDRIAGVVVALTVALALVAIAAVGVEARASATATLPMSPTFLDASHADDGLQVEPATITYTGDGTGFLGGADVRDRSAGIVWKRWTAALAVGSGFNQLNDCNPSCAEGRYRGYAVRIELWRPRKLAGTLVFTRMTIHYRHGRPQGEPRHYTFTDIHAAATGGVGGGYGWGPPSQQGYCTHTHGLKPATGCKHIHSLP